MKLYMKERYHWIIAMVALLELFVHVGIVNNLVGLYVVPDAPVSGLALLLIVLTPLCFGLVYIAKHIPLVKKIL